MKVYKICEASSINKSSQYEFVKSLYENSIDDVLIKWTCINQQKGKVFVYNHDTKKYILIKIEDVYKIKDDAYMRCKDCFSISKKAVYDCKELHDVEVDMRCLCKTEMRNISTITNGKKCRVIGSVCRSKFNIEKKCLLCGKTHKRHKYDMCVNCEKEENKKKKKKETNPECLSCDREFTRKKDETWRKLCGGCYRIAKDNPNQCIICSKQKQPKYLLCFCCNQTLA